MKNFRYLSIFLGILVLSTKSLIADESKPIYGSKGGVELSLSASNMSFTNQKDFFVSLSPAVNHFILNRFFLRYGMDLGTSLRSSGSRNDDYRVAPILGAGYSWSLTEKWFLNVAAFYQLGYVWYTAPFTAYSGYFQSVDLMPELKYMITENWLVFVTLDLNTNLPYVINGENQPLKGNTSISLGFSYYFP
jgi:hypothetical protein